MPWHIGTSGWQYRDWRGVFYPDTCPQRRWLEYYADRFATVENNNAFYRLPSRDTFAAWHDRTPADFVCAVKASRFLTHMKRLRDPAEPVARLLQHAEGLGTKLGPVLVQLPGTLQADPDLLETCLRRFPAEVRVAVEPRHTSWWVPAIRTVLERNNAALCWADAGSRPVTPLWRTAEWGYLRLHRGRAEPSPRYGRQALRTWTERLIGTWPDENDLYIYFNNDPGGAALHDAIAFARLAAAAGAVVTRTPAPLRATA